MDDREIELQALITEREGMTTEGMVKIQEGSTPPYRESDYYALASKIRALKGGERENDVPLRRTVCYYCVYNGGHGSKSQCVGCQSPNGNFVGSRVREVSP